MRQKRLCPRKVGNQIFLLRNKKNISIKNFSSQIGVCSNSLLNWEKGKNLPTLENATKICNMFDIKISDLILYRD